MNKKRIALFLLVTALASISLIGCGKSEAPRLDENTGIELTEDEKDIINDFLNND